MSSLMKEIKVAYLCNGKAPCHGSAGCSFDKQADASFCAHTRMLEFAKNFSVIYTDENEVRYIER